MKKLACLLALLIAGPAMAANDVAGLLDSLWQGSSRGPGAGADAERLRALFHAQARISVESRYEAQAPRAEFVGINTPAAGS